MKFKLRVFIPLLFIIIFSVGAFYFQSQRSQNPASNNVGNSNVQGGEESVSITSTECNILSLIPNIAPSPPTQGFINMAAAGTVSAHVGYELDLILVVDTSGNNIDPNIKLDCGVWTKGNVKYAHTCVREEGDPDSTTWSIEANNIKADLKSLTDWENNTIDRDLLTHVRATIVITSQAKEFPQLPPPVDQLFYCK
ncbi:MAG: hypothetical protein WC297_01590 [Candidatus Paceibacterota bacterium]|jgi:hypothetical protein